MILSLALAFSFAACGGKKTEPQKAIAKDYEPVVHASDKSLPKVKDCESELEGFPSLEEGIYTSGEWMINIENEGGKMQRVDGAGRSKNKAAKNGFESTKYIALTEGTHESFSDKDNLHIWFPPMTGNYRIVKDSLFKGISVGYTQYSAYPNRFFSAYEGSIHVIGCTGESGCVCHIELDDIWMKDDDGKRLSVWSGRFTTYLN